MGHIVGKEIYRKLGGRFDQMPTRTPWNPAFQALLQELYSPAEADFVVTMPAGLSTLAEISDACSCDEAKARSMLDNLCSKGMVVDLWLDDRFYYMPSPFVIGLFEFTMMRTGEGTDPKTWARLFHEYMQGDDSFYAANSGKGRKVSIMRTLPHEQAILDADHIRILDYERAAALIDAADSFSIGLCSCRHEKLHLGQKKCDVELETCTSLGYAADFLVRNGLARRATRSEMHEKLEMSRQKGLVLNADNVQRRISYICHCCKCCCNALAGISKFGLANAIVTSGFIAGIDPEQCNGCGICVKKCPIDAIRLRSSHADGSKKKMPVVDQEICLGCGVCGLQCESGAMQLSAREQRVLVPETTFEKSVLAALERDTLQHLIFTNRKSVSQSFLRGLTGAFFKLPPVKKALMSDRLRSRFLAAMKNGARVQGKGWLLEL